MKIFYSKYIFLFICLFLFSCTYVEKIKDGRSAFERKQYAVALPMLKKEYSKTKSQVEKGKIAFQIAESLKRTNQDELSVDWYLKAYDFSFGVDALKGYAFALKASERYDDALKAFKNLGIEVGSPYEYRGEVSACKNALLWKNAQNKNEYQVKLLEFNSSQADYAPSLLNNNKIVFTSDRNAAIGEDNYKWTGNKFSDLFLLDLATNTISPFDENINSPYNEGTLAINEKEDFIIFARCGTEGTLDDFCKLLFSTKEGDTWSTPKPLPFLEDKINYAHPALSPDGKKLFFACNHPDGWGGFDIYESDLVNGEWSIPKMLGRSINTEGDEMFPTLDSDTLYFSSNKRSGMGGLDIFKTYQLSNKQWAPAMNLKAPLNSGGDDFHYTIKRKTSLSGKTLQVGYFSSNRDAGVGLDDIYAFEKQFIPPPPPPPKKDTVKTKPIPIVYKFILEGYILEKIYADSKNPNSKVIARKPLASARVQVNSKDGSKSINTDEEGFFSIEMSEETDYAFFASKLGFLSNDARFSTKGIAKVKRKPIQTFSLEIVLDKIFKNQEIVLDNIYYDYDQSNIRADAQPTLNALASILNKNPSIKIQLSSHTDCRGRDSYNESLSQKRAQSAVDYLISLGIATERLTAKGYGETLPERSCNCSKCTEEEHQANRRTTFKIIE